MCSVRDRHGGLQANLEEKGHHEIASREHASEVAAEEEQGDGERMQN